MADDLQIRPGVQVVQTFRQSTPTIATPPLVPCIVGPAFEVINVLTTDGTINPKARYGTYDQLRKIISQSSFPDHRQNIDELNILEETVRPFMLMGGDLGEMPMGPGEGFLVTSHAATRAALRSGAFGAGLNLGGKVLVLAIDQPVRLNTTEDVVITFTGTTLTPQQAADQINSAVGENVASAVAGGVLQIASNKYGALSSVTVRAGGSANSLLTLGYDSSAQREERVEGSGWRGQDDGDNDTVTPWIEFYQGDFLANGAATAFSSKAGLINSSEAFNSAKMSAVTFGDSAGKLPLKVGDYFFCDGTRLKSGEVMKVEGARFKMGTVNTGLSTADSTGRYTNKVYDLAEIGTMLDSNPFAPKYVYFRANNLEASSVSPVAATILGATAGTAESQAVINGTGALAGPHNLTGLYLDYIVTVDSVATEGRYTFTAGYADMAGVAASIGSNIPGVLPSTDGATPPQLRLTTSKYGQNQAVTIRASGTANTVLGFSTSADTTDAGTDATFSGLAGKTLKFKLDEGSHLYRVTMLSDSLDEAVSEINSVVGATVASKSGAQGRNLRLTSFYKGMASKVEVVEEAGDASFSFGLNAASTPTYTAGSGRPAPDAFLDDSQNLIIGAQILRDPVTGYPLDQSTNSGVLYVQFKALRRDVTAVAKTAGVLRMPSVDILGEVLDPINEENPLSLGLFMAMLSAPNLECKGLGVDEVTAAAPDGTLTAYARAAGLLESEEVYAVAPLTQDEVIHSLWMSHVGAMSEPGEAGERIVFLNKKMPVRRNPDIAANGTQANSTATANQMLLDVNPASGLVGLGLNPADAFSLSNGVYLEMEVSGELRRYLVSQVTGSLVNLNPNLTAAQNPDGFYSTVALTETVVNTPWALKVRGASLVIPGSNPERLDYSLVAETVATANKSLKMRRVFEVFPDTIKTTVAGIEKELPGYYACASIAGLVAAQPPQQGFTNFPIPGLTGVVGSEKFTKAQLDKMGTNGGTFILVQEVVSGPVVCRHQVSTDLTSKETRELSVTKVVDFVAKTLRQGVRRYIGTQVINDTLRDTLGTTIQAMLRFLENMGVITGYELNNLVQDVNSPDTILVDVTIAVPYPCNYIRITLEV